MNTQEAFDKSMKALVGQAFGSINSELDCRYRLGLRTRGTCACAIGHLIPDEMYREDMEGDSPTGLMKYPDIKSLFSRVDALALRHMQSAHDRAAFWVQKRTPNVEFLENLRFGVLHGELPSMVSTREFEKLVNERIQELKSS